MSREDAVVLDAIPFRVDDGQLLKTLRMKEDGEYADQVRALARAAESIGRPKAIYRPADIESRSDDSVVLDGITFTSRILRVNLDKAYRVFPFVATCGTELEDWSRSLGDLLEGFWADAIKIMALAVARDALTAQLKERHGMIKASNMNPGSLPDWPLPEQRPLFALVGDPAASIGVRLTDSFLMLPTKSLSGIRFPTEVRYENCQLCPREKCPGRHAPYEKGLYERKYQEGNKIRK